jgi:hypothetical protein
VSEPRLLPLVGTTELVAPARPVQVQPARRPGSVRRTSHVDMTWPDGPAGDPEGLLVLDAGARDVVTGPDGAGSVAGEVRLVTTVLPGRRVTDIVAEPASVDLSELIGRTAARGWRSATRRLVPEGLQSPLGLLLDEVPIAVLLSFYAALRSGSLTGALSPAASGYMRDLCAGWATDATPMRSIDAGGGVPLPKLVPVPVDDGADPLAHEPRPPLETGRLRRSRRIDVVPGDVITVDATFRDTWVDPSDGEGILHEYVVTASVGQDGTVLSITADPRVLPYGECPRAVESPQVLVGQHIGSAADVMPVDLSGTSSCTHLNDLLRSLACVPALAAFGGDEAAP